MVRPKSESKHPPLTISTRTQNFVKPAMEQIENSLVAANKFFFVRKELLPYLKCGASSLTSKDMLERKGFEFIKKLSTFISLETVLVASDFSQGKRLNFSSNLNESETKHFASGTESALSIPIKQRLYSYLLELEDQTRYKALFSSMD